MRDLSLSEHWYQLMSKPDGCGGKRISKKKIALTMIGIIILVSAFIYGASTVDSASLPDIIQPTVLMIQGLSSNPIVFSVLLVLIFIALCCSGFTVAQIGKVECALADEQGNTVIDKLNTLHAKVDNLTSEIYKERAGKVYRLKGNNIQEKYDLSEAMQEWKKTKKK